MAYKDEYEVARLHLESLESRELQSRFGGEVAFEWHLHPPLLRALGMKKKLRLGPRFEKVLRCLRAMKLVRGTPFDPFGWAHVRRLERDLVCEYRAMIEAGLDRLSPANHAQVVALASLPDEIRGYEGVKLERVERYRASVRDLRASIAHPKTEAA